MYLFISLFIFHQRCTIIIGLVQTDSGLHIFNTMEAFSNRVSLPVIACLSP